jgi:hypothetical protein
MKRMPASLLAIAATVVILAASATDAPAQWRGRGGWGWRGPGPGIAAGVVAGAVVAGAIIASRPPGYVVYPGYAQPVYAPGCYWASQPVYDAWGHVVGYTGRPVQVCPRYPAPPPAVVVGPPPGPVAGPPPGPAVGPPGPGPGYAAGPPPGPSGGAGGPSGDDPTAYCAQRYRSYDPNTGTFLGNDGQRHPCP